MTEKSNFLKIIKFFFNNELLEIQFFLKMGIDFSFNLTLRKNRSRKHSSYLFVEISFFQILKKKVIFLKG